MAPEGFELYFSLDLSLRSAGGEAGSGDEAGDEAGNEARQWSDTQVRLGRMLKLTLG